MLIYLFHVLLLVETKPKTGKRNAKHNKSLKYLVLATLHEGVMHIAMSCDITLLEVLPSRGIY